MVTLSLLKYLENNGLGVIDEDLFWEKIGLDEVGLYISDIGVSQSRGVRRSTTFQIFSRGSSDVDGYRRLARVDELLNDSFNVCNLPAVYPVTDYGYTNVAITNISTISSEGVDANGRVIYSLTGQIYFGEKVFYSPPQDGKTITTENNRILVTENNKALIAED